jgi:hypothetical protein
VANRAYSTGWDGLSSSAYAEGTRMARRSGGGKGRGGKSATVSTPFTPTFKGGGGGLKRTAPKRGGKTR